MDINYKLMVVKWSIFTLWLQLMFCSYSVHASLQSMESLCTPDQDPFQKMERRIESSLLLELRPTMFHGSCKRIFEAPESHGFYVRLHRPFSSKKSFTSTSNKNLNGGQKARNSTTIGSCLISIYQSRDKSVSPWRIDPCQMEANGNTDELVKFLEAPLRIVWNHGGNMPNYRLTITSYGKGKVCDEYGRHSCLKMGQEKHICISEELICDGVQHCPTGNEFDSDENTEMCDEERRRKEKWPLQLIKEILRTSIKKSFPSLQGDPLHALTLNVSDDQHLEYGRRGTSFSGVDKGRFNETIIVETVITDSSVRKNFTRGLSRYGPWGYLMLGMLLCGGALLICGLWECCCRKHKPPPPAPDENSIVDVNVISNSTLGYPLPRSSIGELIDENNDPPPDYSSLFPSQKDFLNDTVLHPSTSEATDIVISDVVVGPEIVVERVN